MRKIWCLILQSAVVIAKVSMRRIMDYMTTVRRVMCPNWERTGHVDRNTVVRSSRYGMIQRSRQSILIGNQRALIVETTTIATVVIDIRKEVEVMGGSLRSAKGCLPRAS
jgi:hypothetical protein